MKKLLFIIIAIISSQFAFAQNHIGENWKLASATDLHQYLNTEKGGNTLNVNKIEDATHVESASKFKIVDKEGDYYVIEFWTWKNDSLKKATLNVDSMNRTRKFLIHKDNLEHIANKVYRHFTPAIGSMTFPFKYRPQTGVFENTFALNMTGGVRWNFSETNDNHSLSALFGVGPSTIVFNKFNTDTTISNITDPEQRAALTMSLNVVYQWELLQAGLSMGIDHKFDGNREKWIYQGKPWFALGIGLDIFSNSERKDAGKNE